MSATYVYDVPDISCDHCKRAIETALREVEGVSAAVVAVGAKSVTVTTDGSADAVLREIEEVGYPVAGVTAAGPTP